jgi:hypothetical protein
MWWTENIHDTSAAVQDNLYNALLLGRPSWAISTIGISTVHFRVPCLYKFVHLFYPDTFVPCQRTCNTYWISWLRWFMVSIVNQPDAPVSHIYLFWFNTLHVSDGLSVHHQEFKLYIRQQVYVKQVLLFVAICTDWIPGDGRKGRPKHVE